MGNRSRLAAGFAALCVVVTAVACNGQAPNWSSITTTTTAPAFPAHLPTTPFRSDSIWRRPIAAGASYVDISDMTGRPTEVPTHVGPDLVTLCETVPSAPLVDVRIDTGWSMPGRATAGTTVQYRRHLGPDTCGDLRWNPTSNGLFVLYDPTNGRADLGVGGWRITNGPLLNHAPDGSSAHNLDPFGGDGLIGYGRASGLPALGGLLRTGELTNGIDHPLAVNVSNSLLSPVTKFVWPARTADASASVAYLGTNPALAMGTLLALPPSVDVAGMTWNTPQGRNVARTAQRYGWYIVDVVGTPGIVQFGMENDAARADLGLTISSDGTKQTVDPAKIDGAGFIADVARIFGLLRAVPQHA